jgi:cytidylate kinase
MHDPASLDKCLTYIDCHLQVPRGATHASARAQLPAVTLSRETGAGGIPIAEKLAALLNARRPRGTVAWTVFHKNLVEKVLEDHQLPSRLAEFMPEDKVSGIADAMEELLGLHPSSWSLMRQTTETILNLAELGHVILVGRGANVITAHLRHVFHVRLVGSLDQRVARVQTYFNLGKRAALTFIRREDAGRARYLRKHFKRDINDPLLYHLTINTDHVPIEEAAEMIGTAVLKRREGED